MLWIVAPAWSRPILEKLWEPSPGLLALPNSWEAALLHPQSLPWMPPLRSLPDFLRWGWFSPCSPCFPYPQHSFLQQGASGQGHMQSRVREPIPPSGHQPSPHVPQEAEDLHVQGLTFRKILVFPIFQSLSVPSHISAMRRVACRNLSRSCQGETGPLEQGPQGWRLGVLPRAQRLPPPTGFTARSCWDRAPQSRVGSRRSPRPWDHEATTFCRAWGLCVSVGHLRTDECLRKDFLLSSHTSSPPHSAI